MEAQMAYKRTEYPRSYDEGGIVKSIRISAISARLMRENDIDNESAFINDLIFEALSEKDFWKKKKYERLYDGLEEYNKLYGKNCRIVGMEE